MAPVYASVALLGLRQGLVPLRFVCDAVDVIQLAYVFAA